MRYETVELEVHVSELRLGMHVIRLDRPWEETDFLLQGFIIQHRDEIEALQRQCEKVIIEGKVKKQDPVLPEARKQQEKRSFINIFARKDKGSESRTTNRPTDSPRTRHAAAPDRARITYINKVEVNNEISRARNAYDDAKGMATNIMAGIRVGRALDMNKAREVVDACVDSILRNDDALMWLTKLKNKDEYTAEHSINVSVLSAAFGKHLGMLEEEIRTLGLCGLLHDVGKVKVPDAILNKPGQLTPEEYGIMQNHTNFGRDILMSVPQVVHATIDVAYNHHERLDGQGYPRGLKDYQIPHLAKIVAIVDTYDAITSTRVYDRGRSSMEALEIIHRFRGKQFDPDLTKAFIRMIGIYPPGSIVEMTNGEVGIVIASNPKNKRMPKVILVRDAVKQIRAKERVADLQRGAADENGVAYAIAKEVPDGTYGIRLQEYLDKGLVFGHQTVDETSV